MSTQHARARAMVVVLLAVAASCGGSEGAADTGVSDAPRATPGTDAPDFVRNEGDATPAPDRADGDPSDGSGGNPPDSSATTIAVVSDTGVPGIDSNDAFCRSWSEFAGSFRALGLASAVGDPDAAMRLEVVASGAVVKAVEGLGVSLPSLLEPERDALLIDYAGPFARRAARAQTELVNAGVDATDDLAAAWLEQLALTGIDDPELEVALPASVDVAALDRAVDAFAAAVPTIGADPSLVTGANIIRTEAYLVANCPDQGTLGGNDVISS